ncbi:Holliday junction resolvase RuvX [Candidatus Nomurabacteria bacterium]|nr:Holliday junction resolvase RuvX [Candidatus Nomurabacteria bacterium]
MLKEKAKILGLDYGDQRVGVALASKDSMAAPYLVLKNKSFDFLLAELKKIIESEEIEAIVVGLPHSLSGQVNQRLLTTEKFVERLREKINLEIFTVDEQYTSKLYTQQGVTKDLDKYAATAILETWLEQNKNA